MLDAQSRSVAAELQARCDPEAGPLAIVLPFGADFIVTLLGALRGGFTIAAVAPPRAGLHAERFRRMVAGSRAIGIVTAPELTTRITAAGAEAPLPPQFDAAELRAARPVAAPIAVDPGKRPAIIQFTSGSSRFPRGVAVHPRNLLANAALVRDHWGLDEHQTVLNWLPHYHDMGLMSILQPLILGSVSYQMDPGRMVQRPARWLRLISEVRASFCGGPAFAFAHCLRTVRDEEIEGIDLSSWTRAYCGAEPVPAAMMQAFRDRFAPFGLKPESVFASYGLAEHTLMIAGGLPRQPKPSQVPAGAEAIEPAELSDEVLANVRIVDPEAGGALAEGMTGELWVRGASVADGYVDDPAESTATFEAMLPGEPGKWLRTGDIAVIMGNWLFVTGRLKDVLIANGIKVPAVDVEWLASRQHPQLNPMAAAAFAIDETIGGAAALLIELQDGHATIEDEAGLARRIRQVVLGAWAIDLADIRFMRRGTLPRTTSGKIQRRLAAERYRAGSAIGEAA